MSTTLSPLQAKVAEALEANPNAALFSGNAFWVDPMDGSVVEAPIRTCRALHRAGLIEPVIGRDGRFHGQWEVSA